MVTECPHPSTFDCHGSPRCSECHADQMQLRDGTWVWPAQDDPFADWDGERIMRWFFDNKIHWLNQGCDGFEFQRNNLLRPKSTYGYLWIESVIDWDYEMVWLLEVRRNDGTDEYRQHLALWSSPTMGHGYKWDERGQHRAFGSPEGRTRFDGIEFMLNVAKEKFA